MSILLCTCTLFLKFFSSFLLSLFSLVVFRLFFIYSFSVSCRLKNQISPKRGQIGPKWDKSGTLRISFQYILAQRDDFGSESQHVLKSNLK